MYINIEEDSMEVQGYCYKSKEDYDEEHKITIEKDGVKIDLGYGEYKSPFLNCKDIPSLIKALEKSLTHFL